MRRVGLLALMLASLLPTAVGALIALAFAIPALRLNTYGRNPAEVTLVAEGVAITLYLGGGIGMVIGVRHLRPRLSPVLWGVVALIAIAVMWPAIRGGWEVGLLALIYGAALLAPSAVGLLSVRVVPASR